MAELYGIATKVLNLAVRRNKDRFPEDFIFILEVQDFQGIRSQFVTASRAKRTISALSLTFTEYAVTCLQSVILNIIT